MWYVVNEEDRTDYEDISSETLGPQDEAIFLTNDTTSEDEKFPIQEDETLPKKS